MPYAFFSVAVPGLCMQWQSEETGAALALLTFHPDSPAVRLYQSLADCQTQSHTHGLGAKSLLNTVHPVKYSLQFISRDTYPLVGDANQEFFTASPG